MFVASGQGTWLLTPIWAVPMIRRSFSHARCGHSRPTGCPRGLVLLGTRWRCSALRSIPGDAGLTLWVGGVGELHELTGDQEGHLLADVDGVVAHALDLPRDDV